MVSSILVILHFGRFIAVVWSKRPPQKNNNKKKTKKTKKTQKKNKKHKKQKTNQNKKKKKQNQTVWWASICLKKPLILNSRF